MRKLYILGMILAMCATFSACNDEWKEELYTQMISFKAPLGDNSLNEIYVRYQPDGMGYTSCRSLSVVRRITIEI